MGWAPFRCEVGGLSPDAGFILLPPSEGKLAGGRPAYRSDAGTFSRLAPEREAVTEALKAEVASASQARLEKLWGARGALAERATEAFGQILSGSAPVLPAWQRYSGVVWEHLEPGRLSQGELGRILVPSGLVGMSTADDPLPDYRLKMSVNLPPLGMLSRWWRGSLTEAVAELAQGCWLVDLLPAEHAGALDWAVLGEASRVVRVRFMVVGDRGERIAGGHAAKAAKGAFASAILRDGIGACGSFSWRVWRSSWSAPGVIDVVADPA